MTDNEGNAHPDIEHPAEALPSLFADPVAYKQLSAEIVPPARRWVLALIVVGALLVWLAADVAVYVYYERQPTNDRVVVDGKWNRLVRAGDDVDWLLVGDSSGEFGISPDVARDEFGYDLLNLSTHRIWKLVDDVWMIEYYLQHHDSRPRILVMHVVGDYQDEFNPLVMSNVSRSQAFFDRFTFSLDLSIRDQLDVQAARYVPLYYRRDDLIRRIENRVPKALREEQNASRDDDTAYLAGQPAAYRANDNIVTAQNARILRTLAEIAAEYGVEVYLIHSPVMDDLYADPYFREDLDAIEAWLADFVAGYDHVHFLPTQWLYTREQMSHPYHVVEAEKPDLTRRVFEALDAYIAAQE